MSSAYQFAGISTSDLEVGGLGCGKGVIQSFAGVSAVYVGGFMGGRLGRK